VVVWGNKNDSEQALVCTEIHLGMDLLFRKDLMKRMDYFRLHITPQRKDKDASLEKIIMLLPGFSIPMAERLNV
jgi:hypothetical protein